MLYDDYKEFGNIRIIRKGKSDFSTKRVIHCIDRENYHYQFTNKKQAEREKKFFDNQGWGNSGIYQV